jgi:hypothetical protein
LNFPSKFHLILFLDLIVSTQPLFAPIHIASKLAEFLSAAPKNHPDIQGIYIHNSEYLISQCTDDSTIILEDDETSLNATLELLNYFSNCSGLRANFEAIWIGEIPSMISINKGILVLNVEPPT